MPCAVLKALDVEANPVAVGSQRARVQDSRGSGVGLVTTVQKYLMSLNHIFKNSYNCKFCVVHIFPQLKKCKNIKHDASIKLVFKCYQKKCPVDYITFY